MVAFLCLWRSMRHCKSVGFAKHLERSLPREFGKLLTSRILMLSAVSVLWGPSYPSGEDGTSYLSVLQEE